MQKVTDIEVSNLARANSTHGEEGSSYTELELEIVNRFFQSLTVLYGAAKMRATWPDSDLRRAAKRLWAPKIIGLGWAETNRRLEFAAKNMHLKEYEWPNIAVILRLIEGPFPP